MLSVDLEWRIALGIMVKTAMAFVNLEVRISTYVDLEEMIWEVILNIGYNTSEVRF